MLPWQANHIRRNRPDLIKHTNVSAKFLALLRSSNTITDHEANELKSFRVQEDKADRLYDFICSRKDGYWNMLDALGKSNQTGVVKIFMAGIPVDAIEKLNISFLGKSSRLDQLLTTDQIQSAILQLQNTLSIENYIKLFKTDKTQAKELDLLCSNIPDQPTMYIPRYLLRCIGLSPEIFKTVTQDVLVLKNITSDELRNIYSIPKHICIESSTKQLFKKNPTAKFILLDHDDDWKELKGKFDVPIHLLEYQNSTKDLLVLETSGGSKVIHQFLTNKSASNLRVFEENFIPEFTKNSRGACVCDSPGSGKTQCLASLARTAARLFPEKIVGFVNLSHLEGKIGYNRQHRQEVGTKDLLLQILAPTTLAYILSKQILSTRSVGFELFFDALDEVQAENQDQVTHFIQDILKENPENKVYLTSRRHTRHKLENVLGIIAWDLEPFTKIAQQQLLVDVWKNYHAESSEDKLKSFAKMCIQKFESLSKNKENIITEIPLHCWLTAQVYSEDARVFARPGIDLPNCQSFTITSLPNMYEKLLEQRLGISRCGLKCLLTKSRSSSWCDERCTAINLHTANALGKVFPDCRFLGFSASFKLAKDEKMYTALISKGLLERNTDTSSFRLAFVHFSLAEYLAAQFIAKTVDLALNSEIPKFVAKPVLNFLIQNLLQSDEFKKYFTNKWYTIWSSKREFTRPLDRFTINYENVVYFLNSMIPIKSLRQFDFKLYSIAGYIKPKYVYIALLVTLKYDFSNLLELLICYMHGLSLLTKPIYKRYFCSSEYGLKRVAVLMWTASYNSSFVAVNQIAELTKIRFDIDAFSLLANSCQEIQEFSVQCAVIDCNYELVQFLFEKLVVKNFMITAALKACFLDTSMLSPTQLLEREKICRHIVSLDSDNIYKSVRSYLPSEFPIRNRLKPKIIFCYLRCLKDFDKLNDKNVYAELVAFIALHYEEDGIGLISTIIIDEFQDLVFLQTNLCLIIEKIAESGFLEFLQFCTSGFFMRMMDIIKIEDPTQRESLQREANQTIASCIKSMNRQLELLNELRRSISRV